MASRLFRRPLEHVTPELRERAKKVCYSVLYGAGTRSVMEELGIEWEAAKRTIDGWFEAYPGVQAYFQSVRSRCKRDGFVTTLSGRRRYLPSIKSADARLRKEAERKAVNSVCQGSAADLIKLAMIRIDRVLQAPASDAAGSDAAGGTIPTAAPGRLLLQIHDELIFEVAHDRAGALRELVERAMIEATPLRVPLQVRLKQGASWGELQVVHDVFSQASQRH